MIRQMLALIALITGFAAVAEPARAHSAAIESVGQAELRDMGCQLGAVVQNRTSGWSPGVNRQRIDTPKICPRPQIVIIVPPVMLQADRAHE
jgi:hypothetical protein